MLSPEDYPDVTVTVAHPWGDIRAPLETWMRVGPGPRRMVGITAASRVSSGEDVPLAEIPLEYHNCPRSWGLQRQGLLPCPWGPPPEADPWIPAGWRRCSRC